MERTDVLVAGAGPTGLALACGLLMQGVSVRVVDKAPGPAVTSRANFLHARGSEVLARLGALGGLPEESVRAMRVTTYLGGRPIMRLRFGDPGLHTAAPPMVISQARVEAALRDRLAVLGSAPEWDAALVDVDPGESGVAAVLGDGRAVRTGWLVGCDGTGSTVRKRAGIGFPGVKVSERFLLADLHLDWGLDRGGTTGWIHPAGLFGAMPMPDPDGRDDLWRLIAYDPDGTEKPSGQELLDRFTALLPERTGDPSVRVRDAVWLSLFTVHRRLAERYRQGRILIAGDAAHAHAPFGGQGMLTGLGDAENLAWKLALVVRGTASERLLDSYEAERRPLATEVLRGSTAVTRMNITRNAAGRFLRDRVAAPMVNRPWVQRWATYTASQLWVSYRKGPLGGRAGHKPRPGDRVTDLDCTRADGTSTRLHAALGGHWALLLPQTSADRWDSAARQRLGAYVEPLHRTDTGTEEVWLVRPDGHLAWRGHDSAALGRWLDTVLRDGRAPR